MLNNFGEINKNNFDNNNNLNVNNLKFSEYEKKNQNLNIYNDSIEHQDIDNIMLEEHIKISTPMLFNSLNRG